jgi:hypothetical protein
LATEAGQDGGVIARRGKVAAVKQALRSVGAEISGRQCRPWRPIGGAGRTITGKASRPRPVEKQAGVEEDRRA